jgi:hypothetical protein
MTMTIILEIIDQLVNDSGTRYLEPIHTPYAANISVSCVSSSNQLLDSIPNKLPSIVLLLNTMHPIATLYFSPILGRFPSSNAKLILIPQLN